MRGGAYRPHIPVRRPGGRPEQAPRYRVLVHRQFKHLWETLPDRVGLPSAQQFYDHVAHTRVTRQLSTALGYSGVKPAVRSPRVSPEPSTTRSAEPGASITSSTTPTREGRWGIPIRWSSSCRSTSRVTSRTPACLGTGRQPCWVHVLAAKDRCLRPPRPISAPLATAHCGTLITEQAVGLLTLHQRERSISCRWIVPAV